MIFSEELKTKVSNYIDSHRDEAVDFWRDLVNCEGQDGELDELMKTAGFLKEKMDEIGLNAEFIEVGAGHAPIVTGVLNPEAPGKEMVFTGHYDTVFPAGSRGKDPFYIEDGKAYGPGVCDMKGGITIAYFVVKALKEFGFKELPVRLFFLGDEEVNHHNGKAIDYIKEYTNDILVDFNMENRYLTGEICIGRKGCYEYIVRTHGVKAHPGHKYDFGRSAIEEMAYKVIGLNGCTPKDPDREFSVSVGTIHGGIGANVIPDFCECLIDVRIKSFAALEECERRMREVCSKTVIEGTSTELILKDPMPPFETTPQVMEAFNAVKAVSEAIGSNVSGTVFAGGASDAAHINKGTKVVCQCGVRGDFTHNEKEYALVESLYEGIELFIFVALNYELFR